MYKDKEKRKEVNKEANRRYRQKRGITPKGITEQGITGKGITYSSDLEELKEKGLNWVELVGEDKIRRPHFDSIGGFTGIEVVGRYLKLSDGQVPDRGKIVEGKPISGDMIKRIGMSNAAMTGGICRPNQNLIKSLKEII